MYIPAYLRTEKNDPEKKGTGTTGDAGGETDWSKVATMEPVDIVAQKPLEHKTELNDDGTPKQVIEPEPEKFTVNEKKLVEPVKEEPEPAEKPADKTSGDTAAAGTEAEPDATEQPAADAAGTEAEEGDVEDEGKGKSKVKPLNVKPITPPISGDPNETEEEKQTRMALRKQEAAKSKYEEEHPWVLENDYSTMRNKYKDKKWSQIVNEVAAYREKTGNPMSYEEKMYMLSQYNPDTSKKEEVREKRLAYWADALNQLGNVLAHFYNYGRAKGGSPAAQVPGVNGSYSQRLKAADAAMRQRGYNDYVNAMVNEQKRKQTREDMEYRLKMQEAQEQRRLANQIALKEHEWLSPKYKLELERLGKDLSNKDTQHELNKAKLAYQMMINEGKSAEQALEISYKRLRNALANKKLAGGDGKPYKVGDESYANAYEAYKRGIIKSKGKDAKIVDQTKFNKNPNGYLDEAGVVR